MDQSGVSRLLQTYQVRRVQAHKLLAKIEARLLGRLLSPFRQGNMVMFHIGRSGSTVLADLMGQHGRIYWDGEIYEQYFQNLEKDQGKLRGSQVQLDAVDYLRHRMYRGGRKFYGFEVKFFHLGMTGIELEDYLQRLDEMGFDYYIILKRKNFLRKIVSSVIAHKKAHYHQAKGEKAVLNQVALNVDRVKIDRDTGSLIDFLEKYRQDFERLEQLLAGRQVLQLSYEEDILPDPQIGFDRVCDFLQLERRQGVIRYGKTNPFGLEQLLTNFQDVERTLSGTSYEWMLYE